MIGPTADVTPNFLHVVRAGGVTPGTVATLVEYPLFEVQFAILPQFDVLLEPVAWFEGGWVPEV